MIAWGIEKYVAVVELVMIERDQVSGVDLSPTRVSVVSWLAINRHDSTEQGPDCFKRELSVVTT